GCPFERLAIGPHGVMGYAAGWLRGRAPAPIAALALLVGHVLNLALFTLFRLLPLGALAGAPLWTGIAYETVIGVMSVTVMAGVYRLGFEPTPPHRPARMPLSADPTLCEVLARLLLA